MSSKEMLDKLRGEGKLSASGEFKLDRQKAREKMQKFQLRDPHHYVLEFVQAAHLLGAQDVRIRIDADEMKMRLNHATLEREDLEDVYGAAFSSLTDDKTRALRHLAYGLTAAQAMEPSVVRVEVVHDARRVTLEIGPDGEEIVEEVYDPVDGRIAIYLREKFRASHLVDFFRNLRGDLAEKTALREHCAHSPRQIFLDGERISFGYRLNEEVVGQVDIDTPHERGVVGIVPGGEDVRVTILQNGVKVVEHRVKAQLVAARAVIESDRLTKNLSQSAFVEDDEWKAFVDHLLPSALYASIHTFVRNLAPQEIAGHRQWLRKLCARILPLAQPASESVVRSESQLRRLGSLAEALPDLAGLLSSLPLWRVVDQSRTPTTNAMVSIDDVTRDASGELREWVPYTRVYYPEAGLEVTSPALYFPDGPPRLFEELCGERLMDTSAEYELAWERARNKRLWKRRPRPDRPNAQDYPHQESFVHEEMRATLAASEQRRQDAPFHLIHDGHLLRHRDLCDLGEPRFKSGLVPGGIAVSFAGGLPVNRRFDGLDADQAFVELAFEVVEALPDFVARHASGFDPKALQIFVSHFLRGEVHKSLLDVFGISLFKRLGWLEDVVQRSPKSPWALVDRLLSEDAPATLTHPEISARLDLLGPLAEQGLFEGLRGESISLRVLADEHRIQGEILCARASAGANELLEFARRADTDQRIVRISRTAELMLERLFGETLVLPDARTQLYRQAYPELFEDSERSRDAKEPRDDPQGDPSAQRSEQPGQTERSRRDDVVSGVEREAMAGGRETQEPVEPETIAAERDARSESAGPPIPAPTPPPLPDETPEERLLRRLRDQLTAVRGEAHYLLDDARLYALALERDAREHDAGGLVACISADGVAISPRHIATEYAKHNPQDAVALAFLGASVYTSINTYDEEITDSHEAQFLMRLIEHLERQLDERDFI